MLLQLKKRGGEDGWSESDLPQRPLSLLRSTNCESDISVGNIPGEGGSEEEEEEGKEEEYISESFQITGRTPTHPNEETHTLRVSQHISFRVCLAVHGLLLLIMCSQF